MQRSLERREINAFGLVIWRTMVKVKRLLSFWNTSVLLLNKNWPYGELFMSEEKQLTNSCLWGETLLLLTVNLWALCSYKLSVFLFSRLKFRFRNSIELEVNKQLEKLSSHIDLSGEIMPRKLIQAALGNADQLIYSPLFVLRKKTHRSKEAFKAEQKGKPNKQNFL